MSQVNITLNTNTIEVNTTNNQIVVTDPTNPTTVNIVQPITTVVEVITPGPQGPQGPPGTGSIANTGSFVTTSSFNAFTSSFNAFTSSYNTGSFTGSFTGDGSGLTNLPIQNINTSSLATTGSNTFIGNQVISGSLNVSGSITGSLFGTSSFAVSSSRSVSSSFAISASWAPLNAGGSDRQIQFNSGSRLQGTGSFTFNYQNQSLQQGLAVTASGLYSHAQGLNTRAIGNYSHTEGLNTIASSSYSHAEGNSTQAIGLYSHAEGVSSKTGATTAYLVEAFDDGILPLSSTYGDKTYPEFSPGSIIVFDDTDFGSGYGLTNYTVLSSTFDGTKTIITLTDNTVKGSGAIIGNPEYITFWTGNQILKGDGSHVEGDTTTAVGNYSHAEGGDTKAIGNRSHAEGNSTQALGQYSHAEGASTQAIGEASHAEGNLAKAIGAYSHAEGISTQTVGDYSHAEGENTQAIGYASHAEGTGTTASGSHSHAEGQGTVASGEGSHAEGLGTVSLGSYQHVQGQYNISSSAQSAFIIGNGTADNARRNLVFASGSQFQITGSLNVSGSITGSLFGTSSFAVSSSRSVSSSFAISASWAPTQTIDTSSLVTTSSFNAFTSSYNTGSFTGSFNGVFTGSLFGTASRAISASYTVSGGNQNFQQVTANGNVTTTSVIINNDNILTTKSFKVNNTTIGGYAELTSDTIITVSPSGTISAFANGTLTLGDYNQDITNLVNLSVINDTTSYGVGFLLNSSAVVQDVSLIYHPNYFVSQSTYNAPVNFYIPYKPEGTVVSLATLDDIPNTSSFATTGSNTFIGNQVITGSLTATQGITGSLFGTASWATNAITASYALNGGVTQLLAGPNVTLSPTNGLGQVTISSTSGGGGGFNTATGSYGSFYDTTTQTNPVANIPRSMSLNETDITNGVSVSGSTNPFNTYIKTENAGVYDIQFSAQLDKTDSGNDEIVIWLRKNGSDLTDTATTITLIGNNGKQVAAWNWFVNSAANDYYQIIWQSADTNVRLLAEPADGHPGIPSVIVTVNRVDQFLSNTGSFSGQFSGSFSGSGENLNSIPASAIIGLNLSQIATGSVTASVSPTQFTVSSASVAEFTVTGTGVTLGSAITDTHRVTGSLNITGSITATTYNNLINSLKTFNRTQGIYYFEEFMGNQAGALGASYSTVITFSSGNATARTVATTNRTNQQGIIQPQTGTGATNFAGYAYGGLGTNGTLYIGSGSISLETYVTVETLSNATERFQTIFGYYNGSNFSNTANGIFFSYDEAGTMFFEFGAAATPNWKCYTRGASVTTRTNTSIPVVAGQWYKLRIDINAAGNSVTFYIDGTLVATHTTNIPATTTALLITSLINKTVGTTARSLLTDYFMYEEIFTNPR